MIQIPWGGGGLAREVMVRVRVREVMARVREVMAMESKGILRGPLRRLKEIL